MKKNWYKLLVIFILTGSVIVSCKKEREETPDPNSEYQTAQDDMYAQQAAQQTFTSVNNYGINDEGIKSDAGISIEILNPTTGWPRKMTINFDDPNFVNAKGRTGKIYAEFSGKWRRHTDTLVSGTSITITFSDYKVKGIKYDGTLKITYQGLNGTNHSYRFEATNMKFTYTNGEFSTWTTDRVVEWAAGFADAVQSDENTNLKFIIKANSTNSGNNSKGSSYTATVVSDMTFRYCPNMLPITTGTLDITQNGIKKTINFGDTDECDNKFKITINGLTVEIEYSR